MRSSSGFVGIVLLLVLIDISGAEMGAWFWIILMLVFFFLRNFYFAAFELAWRGMTPGKRVFGLRVIDRGGGTLRADAIFARNLIREVEVFIPAMILMIGPFMGGEGWRRLAVSDAARLDGRADADCRCSTRTGCGPAT